MNYAAVPLTIYVAHSFKTDIGRCYWVGLSWRARLRNCASELILCIPLPALSILFRD